MAVDQAGSFVSDNLPAYAGLKVVQAAVPLAIAWSLTLLCFAVAAVAICLAARERRKCMADDKKPRWYSTNDWDNYTGARVASFAAIAGLAFLLIAVVFTGFDVPAIIGWQQYPEAMIIDMALKAVG